MKPELLAEAPPVIKEFLGYVGTIRGKSPKTVEEYYLDLRTFFRYIKKNQGLIPPTTEFDEISISDVDLDLIKTITLTTVYEYMNYLTTERHNKAATRSRKVSSLRTSINLSDVNHGASSIRIVGKGNKERMVYLNDACIDAIDRYIAVRPKNALVDKNALFISKQNKRISPKTVQYIVKKYLAEIELGGPGFSVHKLRHTAATLMYQHGHVDIRVLKDILGHENLGTTEIYTHLSDEQMAKAAKANPLSQVKQRDAVKFSKADKKEPD